MHGPRVAVVAEDPRLAQVVNQRLRSALDQPPLLGDSQTIRPYLSGDAEGLLVLAAANSAQAEPLIRLVQEVYLRQLPPLLFLVDAGQGDELPEFAALDPHVSARPAGIEQADELARLIRDRVSRVRGFPDGEAEPVAQGIRRRLLTTTPSLAPVAERLALAAQHDVTVLLTGETGTGKTFMPASCTTPPRAAITRS